ncbi:LysR family transcriptional regulator [Methylopila turkensis]|uniref:Transcriptional regulator n=1 Tax=Methylopila turkensis TaxID=1437816 RepID=A0A9W6JMG3_9HYPH|nr:LysR family transcriptional regulator [Methylopila turkensis]GLK79862.1 transcriptional regulator [Methylopila turkensis]
MRYDLNLLPVFVALMEERSVTRAAARLGMTQPSMSNALARLRLMLKDQLFVRERYGVQPTPIALELAPVIADALALLDDAVLGQQDFDPATAERLFTIAPNGYVEAAIMPALAARFAEVAPRIRLRLAPYGNDLVETGVVSGTTAMVLGRITDPPDNLVVQHLMDDGFDCVVRADHPEIGARITRKQFETMRHVNVIPPGRMRAGLFQALAKQSLRREVALSVTNFLAVAEMVAVTDHIGTLPRLICRRLVKDPRVRVLPAPVDLGSFPVEMAWHVRYRHDPAHRWLRGMVADTIASIASPP